MDVASRKIRRMMALVLAAFVYLRYSEANARVATNCCMHASHADLPSHPSSPLLGPLDRRDCKAELQQRSFDDPHRVLLRPESQKQSNGPVEGHVNRLKTIKRQMYGRAGVELLRARLLPEPRSAEHQL